MFENRFNFNAKLSGYYAICLPGDLHLGSTSLKNQAYTRNNYIIRCNLFFKQDKEPLRVIHTSDITAVRPNLR